MPDTETSIHLPIAFVDALSHADSIEDVLKVGTDWLTRLFPAARGSIALIDGARIIDRVHRSDGKFDPHNNVPKILPNAPRTRVLETGQPEFLSDRDMKAAGTSAMLALVSSGIRAMMIAPMFSGTKAVGTLSLATLEPGGYNEAHASRLITIGRWIASQARLMQQLRAAARQAETDALTGLANRARLMRVLDGPGMLHLPGADGRVMGLMHIDLDLFKEINDSFGHAMGDAMLRHVAQAMRAVTSQTDLVARVGGDEFIIVTRTDRRGAHLGKLARDVASRIAEPVRFDGAEARVAASIGTAVAGPKDRTADRLIGNADIALYEVKRTGRGGIRAFSAKMRAAYETRQTLLAELKEAVDTRTFEAHFQPQVSLATGCFSGFEMLARWPHPRLGLLDPDDFLCLAAEAGLTGRIDAIVRSKGLAALRRLRADGWEAPKMSFNASARTLADPDLACELLWEVLGQGLAPDDLVIEFREAQLIADDTGTAKQNIAALSEAGFSVELDDFGTGHAAMSTLGTLALTGIKLDHSMISDLPDSRSEAILRAVIGLAGDLGLTVVAKGVETPIQYAALGKLGCHMAQGFGISKPLPIAGLIDFMRGYGKAPVTLAVAEG
ncbi:MAG: EAL domain-containing protein [Rhodobacter sp.]|nr:EAL domain-containing protein [Rhodobacter sp.]